MSSTPGGFHLDNYQWHYRALLVFAPSAQHPDFQVQTAQLQTESSGLQERDLKAVCLLQQGESYAEETTIGETIAAQIRLQFAVEPDEFAVILVGKDGTQKRRYPHPVSTEELFGAIDAMPMRQQEMRSPA